ncbi:lysosome-associated membrane glycoprotein 2-like [Centruroides vittatus]|uniref:lysosome-associated membrane glycoprotein 2-like n=1 Tax=Centruroides vittatus TaxID=120091 RepID=UPI0035102BB1
MKLYCSKMKSYLLFVLGCLIFAGQTTELTANSSASTVAVTETNSSTSETPVTIPPSSNTTTTIITTTAAANVTTSSPPPTTALPPPVNDPSTGSWTVYGVNGTNCIKLEAAIQFRIKYEQISGNNVTAKLNLPTNATVENNTCDNAFIKLTFGQNNTFEIFFKNESNEISATKFTFNYFMDPRDFPDAKQQSEMEFVSATNLTEFKASAGKSFLCKIETKIDMKNVELSMQDLRVEAFRQSKEDKFSEATECAGDEKINDIVPIAVGCALAVLVIIVLIAYLVGRQRSRQQGYQSV